MYKKIKKVLYNIYFIPRDVKQNDIQCNKFIFSGPTDDIAKLSREEILCLNGYKFLL
jgi:hypothetical protein